MRHIKTNASRCNRPSSLWVRTQQTQYIYIYVCVCARMSVTLSQLHYTKCTWIKICISDKCENYPLKEHSKKINKFNLRDKTVSFHELALYLSGRTPTMNWLCISVAERLPWTGFVSQWQNAFHELALYLSGRTPSMNWLCISVAERLPLFVSQWQNAYHELALYLSGRTPTMNWLCISVAERLPWTGFVSQWQNAYH